MLIVNKKILFAMVILTLCVTIGLPLAQIVRYENVINNGTSYKVKCRAYDPYDPFMGRYVRLNLSETIAEKDFEPIKNLNKGRYFYHRGFVQISTDENGFVKYEKLIGDNEKPISDKNYLKCSIHKEYQHDTESNKGAAKLRITVEDIDRYYMSDKLAKSAEDAIREVLRAGNENSDSDKLVYVELKVLHTRAVPMQLYIDDTKIEDYIRKQ